jgi:hypothetical protein
MTSAPRACAGAGGAAMEPAIGAIAATQQYFLIDQA